MRKSFGKDGRISFIQKIKTKRKEDFMEHYEVWLDKINIYVRNAQGDVASKPIARYERLHKASDEQRNAYELSSCGVHWFDLDIDLAFDSFFHPEKYNLLAM